MKVRGHHTTQPSIETVGEGFRRKGQEKSIEVDFGKNSKCSGNVNGRGTADGMYVLRQMVEKRLKIQGSMGLGQKRK